MPLAIIIPRHGRTYPRRAIQGADFFAAENGEPPRLDCRRHGTGKTVTLQTLAENFSARGVAVFMADVKGDLAGLSQAGANNPKARRAGKGAQDRQFHRRSLPGRVLGCVRRTGTSRARDCLGNGAAAARTICSI